jgi:tetratricopeptide (TPR) repeat protein
MKGRLVLAGTFAALVATSGAARGETPPGAWDIARDPDQRTSYELHLVVRGLLEKHALMLREDRGEESECRTSPFIEEAKSLLEEAGPLRAKDVRLQFDLGDIEYRLCNNQAAITTLKAALASAPDHPAAPAATLDLAYAFAKLGAHAKDERDAYRAYLAKSTSERERPIVLLNMAEAEMHLGLVDESIATYREAESASNSVDMRQTSMSSVWGLAVVLDRSGDPRGALEAARRALELDPSEFEIKDPEHGGDRGIFFVPAYEREWYLALGATARAHQPGADARDVAVAWTRAAQHWEAFVRGAEADLRSKGDVPARALLERWTTLAKSHFERAKAERAAAEKRIPRTRTPPGPAAPNDGEFHF